MDIKLSGTWLEQIYIKKNIKLIRELHIFLERLKKQQVEAEAENGSQMMELIGNEPVLTVKNRT